jgi:hypothetical protein
MSARRLPTFLVFSALLAACTLPGVSKAPSAPYTGGTYNVGDTGPGGGIVFYVHQNGTFASIGSDCGSSCKYLEFAPADLEGEFEWCSDTESELNVSETGIGAGMANTTTADVVCASGAIQVAADYVNNGKTDWHLPSMDELNELCKYAGQQTTGERFLDPFDMRLDCVESGSIRTGFSADLYWSSSEYSATNAWVQDFNAGYQIYGTKAGRASGRVRPVRAF